MYLEDPLYLQKIIFIYILARPNCTYTCPSDCVVTKYDIIHSGLPRSKYDLELYITSLSKKDQEMDQIDQKIKNLDSLCITPEDKVQIIKELKQLRQSIIFNSTHLHFFWQHETLVSHYRDRVYSLWDMIGKETTYTFFYHRIIQY